MKKIEMYQRTRIMKVTTWQSHTSNMDTTNLNLYVSSFRGSQKVTISGRDTK